jgi:fatty acid desaturase
MQVRGSANFCNGSWLFTRVHGGINYQIEHHLLPNVCHEHYAGIASIVRSTCAEFKLPYDHHPTLLDVWRAYMKQIRASNPDVSISA